MPKYRSPVSLHGTAWTSSFPVHLENTTSEMRGLPRDFIISRNANLFGNGFLSEDRNCVGHISCDGITTLLPFGA